MRVSGKRGGATGPRPSQVRSPALRWPSLISTRTCDSIGAWPTSHAPFFWPDDQTRPREARDTGRPLPTTMWSSTRTSIMRKASRRCRVRSRSARLGSATPEMLYGLDFSYGH